eukprot:scaffold38086_cov20-Tisochrysis_lutea.AAC.2
MKTKRHILGPCKHVKSTCQVPPRSAPAQSFRPTLVVSCVELGQATLRQHLTPALNLSNANVPLTPQKLASLMELDQATLRQQLTCLKAKSYSLQWTGGADATQGQYLSASDIDFYIDTDASGREMVNVSDTVHQKQHTDFLARHISECACMFRDGTP